MSVQDLCGAYLLPLPKAKFGELTPLGLGHLDPHDVGNSEDSNRTIIVDWAGPVVGHKEEWRRPAPRSRKQRLFHVYSVRMEGTGLGYGELPDGWISGTM